MCTLKCKDFFDPGNPNIATGCGTTTKKCEHCDLELGTIGIYETHLNKVHEKPSMEYCDECATAFKRRMGLILHFRQTHMAPDGTYKKALGCDLCDAFLCINGFSSYDELVEHTENIHGKVFVFFINDFLKYSISFSSKFSSVLALNKISVNLNSG